MSERKAPNLSSCPTCGSRYLDSVPKNYTILTGRTICTDEWHAGWQVPANNLDHEQVSTGDIIDKLDMDEPAKGAPVPGEVPTDPLDALIVEMRNDVATSYDAGTRHWLGKLESARAAHDAPVRADAVKAIPGDPLDALIANGREKALEYREIARVARNNGHDAVADHANGKATSLFLFLKELESIRADHDALVSRRVREEIQSAPQRLQDEEFGKWLHQHDLDVSRRARLEEAQWRLNHWPPLGALVTEKSLREWIRDRAHEQAARINALQRSANHESGNWLKEKPIGH